MKKILTSVALLATLSQADFIGAEIGAAVWNPSLSGDVKYQGTTIDYESDLGFDSDTTTYFWASFEHPVPLIPNLKLKHTKLSLSASKTLTTNVTFANTVYSASSANITTVDLDQTDMIAYYEILDNWVNLDLGINIKLLQGNIKLDNTLNSFEKDFVAPIPMAYAKAQFDLPFTGAFAAVELSALRYDNNCIRDVEAAIGYESSLGFGAKAGYRAETLTIDDIKDIDTDTTIGGAFFSLYYHF